VARLRNVLAGAPIILSVVDAEGICRLSEGKGLQALGVRAGEGVGRNCFEALARFPDLIANLRRALGGDAFVAVVRMGRLVFETHHAPSFGPDGRVTAVTLVSTDVTLREQALDRLRESEARLRTVVENASDIIAVLDPKGVLSYVSPNVTTLTGWRPEELLGRPFDDRLHPEDLEAARLAYHDALTREKAPPIVVRLQHRDGSFRSYESAVRWYDGADGARWVVLIARDVTERARSESALRESEAKHRALAENAHDLICEIDTEGRFLYVSPNYLGFLGYAPEELIGHPASEYVHPEDLSLVASQLQEGFAQGTARQAVYRFRHRNGEWRWFESSGKAFRTAAGEAHGVVISRDVTERRRTEEALRRSEESLRRAQKMEAVGRLAGGVAHDFNNMLLVILGNAAAVLEQLREDDPLRSDVIEIREAARHAADVTRQLLAFGRGQVLQPRVMDLNQTVRAVRRMLRHSVPEDVELLLELDPALGRVRADPAQIEQVIVNLVLNACDAMPKGGRLTLRTANGPAAAAAAASEDGAPYVELAVVDTGTGMDEEVLQHVFEPFFTTKEVGRGTGLGLATVYGIVHQSGGSVLVESARGRGTTFRVRLPHAEGPLEAPPPEPRPQAVPSGARARILLVEDEPSVRRHLQRALERDGHRVRAVADAAHALALAERPGEEIDLLVTDVVMPGMSGPALAARLAAQRPGLRILYVSGYVEDVLAPRGALTSSAAFLEKPFTPEVLTAKVREVLKAPPTSLPVSS
jgi:PAS domain S-box-containing protein